MKTKEKELIEKLEELAMLYDERHGLIPLKYRYAAMTDELANKICQCESEIASLKAEQSQKGDEPTLPSDEVVLNESILIRLIRFAQEGHIYTRGDYGSKAFTFENGEDEVLLNAFKKKYPKAKWFKSQLNKR